METINEARLNQLTNIVYSEHGYDDRYSDVSEPDWEPLYDKELLKESISNGIKQGIEEAINSIWHDYTELPDFKQPIVYTIECAFNSIYSANSLDKWSFYKLANEWGKFKWAYSKDILPKEYFKI